MSTPPPCGPTPMDDSRPNEPSTAAYVEAKSLDGSLGAIVEIGPDATDVVVPLAPTATARGVLLDEESSRPRIVGSYSWGRYAIETRREAVPLRSPTYADHEFTTDGEGRFTLPGLIVGRTYDDLRWWKATRSGTWESSAPQAPGPIDAVTLRIGYGNPRLPENLVVFRNDSPDVGKVLPEFAATDARRQAADASRISRGSTSCSTSGPPGAALASPRSPGFRTFTTPSARTTGSRSSA